MEDIFGLTWRGAIVIAIDNIFPIASIVNLCLISLDQLHATRFPFRHCLMGKSFYFKIILVSWFVSFLLAALMAGLYVDEAYSTFSYVWVSFSMLTLLVLVVSYTLIISNVRRSPHSQNHGSICTEMKLSVTLFIVTLVSILSILPWTIYESIPEEIKGKWSNGSNVEIHEWLALIYFVNSIVNPLVYAIRMREFRKAIGKLVPPQSQAEHRQLGSRAEHNEVPPL